MEGLIVLAILFLAVPLVVSVVALARFGELKMLVQDLQRRLTSLEARSETRAAQPSQPTRAIPPPLPDFLKRPATPPPPKVPESPPVSINWESVLGVKLFAWIGGLALFLGVVFFVKYAFENNWITPLMRVLAGALAGTALILTSIVPALRRYRVPAQSLCATGILILYADVYAAYSFYSLITLTAASVLMWGVTAVALLLATSLNAQSAALLGVLGGFLTPALFRTEYDNPVALFGYIAVFNCAAAALSALKRWNYFILLAAVGSVLIEFSWLADAFGPAPGETARIIFLGIEAEFLAICFVRRATKAQENWSLAAAALAGFAALLFCLFKIDNRTGYGWEIVFPALFFAIVGLIAAAVMSRSSKQWKAAIIGGALAFSWLTEWVAFGQMVGSHEPLLVFGWYVAILLLFAGTPYFYGVDRPWPWMISALAGPLQFWFCYQLLLERFPAPYRGLLPVAFALPPLIGVLYLVKKARVALLSADSRLAVQGAAVLAFISLIFPVQFEREWIAIGWAIEGFALILLFRWIPNRRLRAVALIILCAAFVRLALNPAVLDYHRRTRVPIWNWYLYAYGVAALCLFLSARWFGDPFEKQYERSARPMLYSLSGILLFLLMNIEIADYFSIGPTLTFSFTGNFARDMTYTIAWSLFAFALLMLGIWKKVAPLRLVGIALLCLAFGKLFLHDLDTLNRLYRIGALVTVATIAIVVSFVYQRFLAPDTNKTG
jgi:uncharacterized membrane protein